MEKKTSKVVFMIITMTITTILVFSVTSSKKIKMKIKTIRVQKSRIWEMKGGKYTKTLAKIWVEMFYPNL